MQGRKPTRYEWPILEANDLNTKEWLVQKVSINEMQLINKKNGKIIVIPKKK